MRVDLEDLIPAFLIIFAGFAYISIGAFFAFLLGMEISLAYFGVLFFWPMLGFALYVAAYLAWTLVAIAIVSVAGIFSKESSNA